MIVTNSLTGGGAERSMNLISNELFSRGWPVTLVVINSGPPDQITPLCEMISLDRQWKGGVIETLRAIFKFNRVVRQSNPGVIFLNCDLPELFGALLFSKRKIVVIEHSSRPWVHRRWMGIVIRFWLKINRSRWAAVSSHLHIWPFNIDPDFILPNMVARSKPIELEIRTKSISRLIFIGRLSFEKRPELAIEVAIGSNLELEVIGEGILRATLEEQAKFATRLITFKGHISKPWDLIRSGDLLVATSLFEGDGLVIIEALQANVPMLLIDIPDFRRFGFPEENYCLGVDDFIAKIYTHKENLEELLIPADIRRAILQERLEDNIVKTWERAIRD